MGIDEAGRGPVIGPLIIAAVTIKSSQLTCLKDLNLKDSKLVPRPEREKLCRIIKKHTEQVQLATISPKQIDNDNINRIEIRTIASFINQLNPDQVYFDLPVNPGGSSNFHRQLQRLMDNQSIKLIGENKADNKYPLVSAASILAKVERDRKIRKLHEKYGDFGWGYPAEERTKNFLIRCYKMQGGFPRCVRKRWATVKRIEESFKNISFPFNESGKDED